jgi:hypothetical protein
MQVMRLCPAHLRPATPQHRSQVHITAAMFSEKGEVLATYNDENIYLFEPDRHPAHPRQVAAAARAAEVAAAARAAEGGTHGGKRGRSSEGGAVPTRRQRQQQRRRRQRARGLANRQASQEDQLLGVAGSWEARAIALMAMASGHASPRQRAGVMEEGELLGLVQPHSSGSSGSGGGGGSDEDGSNSEQDDFHPNFRDEDEEDDPSDDEEEDLSSSEDEGGLEGSEEGQGQDGEGREGEAGDGEEEEDRDWQPPERRGRSNRVSQVCSLCVYSSLPPARRVGLLPEPRPVPGRADCLARDACLGAGRRAAAWWRGSRLLQRGDQLGGGDLASGRPAG